MAHLPFLGLIAFFDNTLQLFDLPFEISDLLRLRKAMYASAPTKPIMAIAKLYRFIIFLL
jgi:hypothetical protein